MIINVELKNLEELTNSEKNLKKILVSAIPIMSEVVGGAELTKLLDKVFKE